MLSISIIAELSTDVVFVKDTNVNSVQKWMSSVQGVYMSIAITFRNISLSLLLPITEAVDTLQNAFFSSSLSMSNLGIRDIVSFVSNVGY